MNTDVHPSRKLTKVNKLSLYAPCVWPALCTKHRSVTQQGKTKKKKKKSRLRDLTLDFAYESFYINSRQQPVIERMVTNMKTSMKIYCLGMRSTIQTLFYTFHKQFTAGGLFLALGKL